MAVSESEKTTLDIGTLLPAGTHLIGGEWVASRSGETLDVINPATGETLAAVPRGSAGRHRRRRGRGRRRVPGVA